jgi:hypothetical protein
MGARQAITAVLVGAANMLSKSQYVQRKWRQVSIPLGVAATLALIYVAVLLLAWINGNNKYVVDDLFELCCIVVGFLLSLYWFLHVVKLNILSRLDGINLMIWLRCI